MGQCVLGAGERDEALLLGAIKGLFGPAWACNLIDLANLFETVIEPHIQVVGLKRLESLVQFTPGALGIALRRLAYQDHLIAVTLQRFAQLELGLARAIAASCLDIVAVRCQVAIDELIDVFLADLDLVKATQPQN